MNRDRIIQLSMGYFDANISSQFVDCETENFLLHLEHYLTSWVCFLSLCMMGIR